MVGVFNLGFVPFLSHNFNNWVEMAEIVEWASGISSQTSHRTFSLFRSIPYSLK